MVVLGMAAYHAALGWLHASLVPARVDVPVPDPKMPDSKDIVNKGNDAGDWLSVRSQSFWTIIVILIVAALVAGALKKPVIRGMLFGAVLLAIVLSIVNN